MKKFILALTISTMALTAQAVVFNGFPVSKPTGTTAYAFNGNDINVVTEALSAGTFLDIVGDLGDSINTGGKTFAEGADIKYWGCYKDVGNHLNIGSYDTKDPGTPGYIILFKDDGAGNLSYQVSSVLEFVQSAMTYPSPHYSISDANFGDTWTDYTAAPEPTTLALLLMGVAAVGLRRKARA